LSVFLGPLISFNLLGLISHPFLLQWPATIFICPRRISSLARLYRITRLRSLAISKPWRTAMVAFFLFALRCKLHPVFSCDLPSPLLQCKFCFSSSLLLPPPPPLALLPSLLIPLFFCESLPPPPGGLFAIFSCLDSLPYLIGGPFSPPLHLQFLRLPRIPPPYFPPCTSSCSCTLDAPCLLN